MTTKPNITVEQWVALFQEIGLDRPTMKKWHRLFEQRHPEAHQNFLEWLGADPAKIAEIRSENR